MPDERRRPSGPGRGGATVRLSILAGLALLVAVALVRRGCAGEPGDAGVPDEAGEVAVDERDLGETRDDGESTPADEGGPRSCAELSVLARTDADDAVVLGWLCPDVALDPVAARAWVSSVADPRQAALAAERLATAHPGLSVVARFVAQTAVEPADAVPRPEQAGVSPLSAQVVAIAQRARSMLYTAGIGHDERTRARAYLGKAALQATLQLGMSPGREASPLARLVAGIGMHQGRGAAIAHWQRRVAGLAPVFAQIEDALLDTLLALQATAYHGDPARLIAERDRVRAWVLSARSRIDKRRKAATSPTLGTVDAVWPLVDELSRLAYHGLVDRGVELIVAAVRAPGGPGLALAERLLTDRLAAADRPELVPRVAERLRGVRGALPESRPGELRHGTEPRYPSSATVADDAAQWLARATAAATAPPEAAAPPSTPGGPPFAARRAFARAVLLLRLRPDAIAELIDRALAADASESLTRNLDLLVALCDAYPNPSPHALARRARADQHLPEPADVHDAEARRRRAFATGL